MSRWADLMCALPMIEAYLGWIPCMYLQMCARSCGPSQDSNQRLLRHLSACGLRLPSTPQLPFGVMVRLLEALGLANLRRFDDPSVQGPCWQGEPGLELRVAIRHRQQAPSRLWPMCIRGTPVSAEHLVTSFPKMAFQAAIPTLLQHGRNFYLHKFSFKRFRDLTWYTEGVKVEVTTLYCVVLDFEVYLRCTRATEFDPEDTQTSSGSDSS